MALEAQVPAIPTVVWGAHRMWTKDHPKSLGRNHIPIAVATGTPLSPTGTVESLEDKIRTAMQDLLYRTQEKYQHPAGAYWVPRRLGGGAPTIEEAEQMEEAELAERARRQTGSQ